MDESTITIPGSSGSIAKRSDWIERQPPSVKTYLYIMNNISRFEDYRPSLKKLVDAQFERYSEPFKSPNTPT